MMMLIFAPACLQGSQTPITKLSTPEMTSHNFAIWMMSPNLLLAATISQSPVFNPQDLIGRSFLMDKQSDGQKPRATIVQLLEDQESSFEDNPT
jgi:hypothetical protein